jgi:hypothetical protein
MLVPPRDERFYGALGRGLPVARHPEEPGDAARPDGEGHDAEAVVGPQVVHDEPQEVK